MDAIKEGMLASAKAAEAAARIGERLFCQNTPNVMTFNSQICTSREQSERLLALGLKKETADMNWEDDAYFGDYEDWNAYVGSPKHSKHIPAWSLHRLIILIGNIACDWIFRNDDCYTNAINCIEWLIKKGYFNKEYLVNLTGTDSHQDMVDAIGYALMAIKKEE